MTHASPSRPAGGPASGISSARAQQDVVDTVHRVMGDDIVAATEPSARTSSSADGPGGAPAGHTATGDGQTMTDAGQEQAGQVIDTVKQAGANITGSVQDQAGAVAGEVGRQARDLLTQAQSELSSQAGSTQQRAAQGLRALADELHSMAENSPQDGAVTDLARQAADRAHQAAGWLGDRDPGALLNEVRSFGRRRPVAFLAIAVGAGVLAGRLTRGLTATPDSGSVASTSSPSSSPNAGVAVRGESAP